ncbi:MAG: hypothetical protein WCF04_05210 [Candidatus Nanopelagicales bacterium]
MTPTRPFTRTLAAATAAGVLLTGCTSDPGPATSSSSSPSQSASATASVSPTPTSTLNAAKQQALDEATEAVRAHEQKIYDILADPEPRLDDMNTVAVQPQLDLDLRSLQQIVVAGKTTVETTGPVVVVSSEPVKFDLKGDPPTVTLVACVDRSANSGTEDGKPWTGLRQESEFRVVKTTFLPDPGWAVAKVLPPKGHDQPQPC